MSDDLAAFLAARLDEDEAAARAYVNPDGGLIHRHGTSEPGWREHSHMGGGVPHEHDPETGFQVPLAVAVDDPGRALREVEAKRAIIACASDLGGIMEYLATVYRDHPDYRAEWAP